MSKTNDHARAHRAYHTYAGFDNPNPVTLKALKDRLDRYDARLQSLRDAA